jgi:hypothetical protein
MFSQLGMNLGRPLALFPEMFDDKSLLYGYGKHPDGV